MMCFRVSIVFLTVLCATSNASIIQELITKASNFWPGRNDVGEGKQQMKLPKMSFELPQESEEFIKEGLLLIDAPRESLDLCTHRVIHNLKKNCNQLNLEEIGKLSVMMLNCQLEIEGRATFPCKPEMSLQQCTMGMTSETHQAYSYMTHRAVGICSALKQDQYRALAEITVNRLMQAAQSQVSAMNEALKTQRRLNEMGSYNMKELNENDLKMKEKQAESLEKLRHAENLIEENLASLQQELHLRQKAEEKLSAIDKSTDDISLKLSEHTRELDEGHEKLLENIEEISETLQKNNQELLAHFEETLAFLENLKSFVKVFAQIGTSVESFFERNFEVFPDLGLKFTEELVSVMFLNLLYFICGMIFLLFIDARIYTKAVLITLVAFNSIAAAFRTKTPLFAINFFIWFALCAFKFGSMISSRLSKIKFNVKLPSLRLPVIRKSHESDDSEDELKDINRFSKSRSPSPWPKKEANNHKGNQRVKDERALASGTVFVKPKTLNNCYLEADDTISLMNVAISRSMTPITPPNTYVPGTPVAPRSRPMTPTIQRILRESISEAPERPATPFKSGMTGRSQCMSKTMKGVQCRNAAVIGCQKCRIHNY